jgi:hypothetical protein
MKSKNAVFGVKVEPKVTKINLMTYAFGVPQGIIYQRFHGEFVIVGITGRKGDYRVWKISDIRKVKEDIDAPV